MAAPAQPATIPVFDLTQEVRFAVVIYGGVSLAIYINGVVQEMLRLVRATATTGEAPKGSEKVYQLLSQIIGHPSLGAVQAYQRLTESPDAPIRTRFVIDVLSGTSAGGINAIFLAKALVNDQSLDHLERLWIKEGDIQELLNDRKSLTVRLTPEQPPQSLLNSNRMYMKLLEALDEMDASRPPGGRPALVDQLDLFSTTTDITGLILPIALTEKPVDEKRHRNVFHFQHPTFPGSNPGGGPPSNDFQSDDNPFLAFAARCTSAFPFAFQPMALCDIFPIVQTAPAHRQRDYCDPATQHWQRYYVEYIGNDDPSRFNVPFAKRAFGDGGYLDNKPFSYAIETIFKRQAELPVIRKLVYVEPSPEQLRSPVTADRPDAVENSLAALVTLPRYETIRQDLERVLDRNLQVQRVKRAVDAVGQELVAPPSGANPETWLKTSHETTRTTYGGAYSAYEHLKVSAVADTLVQLVERAFDIDERSGYATATRILADVWIESKYPTDAERRQFLMDFDIGYRLRRIRRLRQLINDLHRRPQVPPNEQEEYRGELQRIKAQLKQPHDLLQSMLDRPWRRSDFPGILNGPRRAEDPPDAVETILPAELKLIIDPADLDGYSGTTIYPHAAELSDVGREERAHYVYHQIGRDKFLQKVADTLKVRLVACFQSASPMVLKSFEDVKGLKGPVDRARKEVRECFEGFEAYDSAMFPITFGSDLGEQDLIDIYRISPDDANARRDDVTVNGSKVKGQAMGAFASFLDGTWRENDILWGRLDGAQRLIEMLLPAHDPTTMALQRALIDKAHEEITIEYLKLADTDRPNWKRKLNERIAVVHREPEPELVARSAARATAVIGAMLEDIAEKRRINRKPFRVLALAGRFLWEFVEVCVPRSMGELFFVYWLQLLLLFALVLSVIGSFAGSGLLKAGLIAFVVLAATYVVRMLLRRYLKGRTVLTAATLGLASAVACIALAVLAANAKTLSPGLYSVAVWLGEAASHWWRRGTSATQPEIAAFLAYLSGASFVMTMLTGAFASRSAKAVEPPPGGPRRPVLALELASTWQQAIAVLGASGHYARKQMRDAIRADYPFIAAYTLLFLALGAAFGFAGQNMGWLLALLGLVAGVSDVRENAAMLDVIGRSVPDNHQESLPRPPRPAGLVKWITVGLATVLALVLLGLAWRQG